MALESGTYINSLNASNPASTDGLGQADDHLRLIKGAIKNTLPNITGAISANQAELNVLDGTTVTTAELNKLDGLTATTAELNYTDGVTSNIQTQLNSKAPSASPTLTGTTTVSTVAIGGFTVSQGYDGRLDFKVGTTTVMSLDQSGNLRVRADISAFDTSA